MQEDLPSIVLSQRDHERLLALATLAVSRLPEVNFLLRELERAQVTDQARINSSTVTMGSQVDFSFGRSTRVETVTLAFPGDQDLSTGHISILTPVGAALIGLSEGQTIAFQAPVWVEKALTVLRVRPPSGAHNRVLAGRSLEAKDNRDRRGA
ncbi:MAG: nucleoside diphosphate kinase regulator [Rhodospirillales bacterium]|nr:nucleoside diphosphate kinase regulator [Rhodospirillales bacterium]